jgi:ribonuclease BN (tRNA processing enzyme)
VCVVVDAEGVDATMISRARTEAGRRTLHFAKMLVTFLGTGDAFGSGGRLQTCISLQASSGVLIDCGATALIGMKRFGIDPQSVDVVVLTHLHGDHFAGLAYLIRETQIATQRTKPLTIIGPAGYERVVRDSTELLFPGASGQASQFELRFVDYTSRAPLELGSLTVLAMPGIHTLGTNPHAVRVTWMGTSSHIRAIPSGQTTSSRSPAAPMCSCARPIV